MQRRTGLIVVTGLLACIAGLAAIVAARAADPDALWKIVHGRCVPDQESEGDPKPCAAVNLQAGYAVLKDIVGATQYLLIPTSKITGIESPELLSSATPNYFAEAWAARGVVEAAAHRPLPPEMIGLAINAQSARSQNQLHIHIDCLRPDVIAALQRHVGTLGLGWAAFPEVLAGHTYMARRLDEALLAQTSPFRLLAEALPAAAADMGHQTLVLAGLPLAGGDHGLVLLADHADAATGDFAHGEDLQDHACAAAAALQ